MLDNATDALMQRLIREELHGCTIIAVAYRVSFPLCSLILFPLSKHV